RVRQRHGGARRRRGHPVQVVLDVGHGGNRLVELVQAREELLLLAVELAHLGEGDLELRVGGLHVGALRVGGTRLREQRRRPDEPADEEPDPSAAHGQSSSVSVTASSLGSSAASSVAASSVAGSSAVSSTRAGSSEPSSASSSVAKRPDSAPVVSASVNWVETRPSTSTATCEIVAEAKPSSSARLRE